MNIREQSGAHHHPGHQRITDCSHGNGWVGGGGGGSEKCTAKAECPGVSQGSEARPNSTLAKTAELT